MLFGCLPKAALINNPFAVALRFSLLAAELVTVEISTIHLLAT
jgi:hypothetical protein